MNGQGPAHVYQPTISVSSSAQQQHVLYDVDKDTHLFSSST